MKNKKTVVIAAVGAVAILVAVTVATACIRGCSADANGSTVGQGEVQQAQTSEEALASKDPKEAALTVLIGNVWEAEGATLTFKDGRYIEAKGDDQTLSTFDVRKATEQEGGYAVTIEVDATKDAAEHDVLIVLSKDSKGAWTVASDGFAYAATYTQSATTREPVKVEGITDELDSLIDGDRAGIVSAVQAYARTDVPGATKATWTGNVLLDCKAGSTTTTFSCDDAAKTLITVMHDASGKYTVAG